MHIVHHFILLAGGMVIDSTKDTTMFGLTLQEVTLPSCWCPAGPLLHGTTLPSLSRRRRLRWMCTPSRS